MNKDLVNLISRSDPEIAQAIAKEFTRQHEHIELIASENFASPAVMAAQGSTLTNKYAEGYPNKRFYSGCEYVDNAEELAIARLKKLFNCEYANVQPHSGSQANQAVYLALLQPGDKILGMSLNSGGHLTHGAAPNLSGKWFEPILYEVDPTTHLIDYDQIEQLALKHRPKIIVAGFSAYSRALDFERFRNIADQVGAYLIADIAHIAGLVATNHHPNPFPHAHVVTSTTHKTLRGPRGGIILTNDEELSKKIDRAVFPGLQGGPLMHVIAAKAIAFFEALHPQYKDYIGKVVQNAQIMASTLMKRNYQILTGGTDNHMILIDLRPNKLTGKEASAALEKVNISSNKNAIPFDQTSPFITSGLRIGSAAGTTRGFRVEEFTDIANLIADILDSLQNGSLDQLEPQAKQQVAKLIGQFPIYT